ncbi:membrane protein insertase YidC [Marinobacteraceae bacterium S3BR75-40.1]
MDIQRTVIWAGLAVVAYLLVMAWNEDYHQTPAPQTTQSEQAEAPQLSGSESTAPASDEFSAPDNGSGTTSKSLESKAPEASRDGGLITVETDVLDLQISRRGGNIVRAELKQYDRSKESEQPLVLLRDDAQLTYMVESALIGRDGPDAASNGGSPLFDVDQDVYKLTVDQDTLTVDLHLTTDSGVKITKRYTLKRDSYEINVDYLLDNQSDQPWKGNLAGKIVRDNSADPTAQSSFRRSFLGPVLNTPEDPYEKYPLDELQDTPIKDQAEGGWIAFLQHYFLTAWVPPQNQVNHYQSTRRGDLYVVGFVSDATEVAPGQQATLGGKLYIGPKIIERLEKVAPNLDHTVDFGWLFFIAYPLFVVLKFFHGLVSNWGVAIILLTVSVKAVFFHLSATSYRSMANMRRVAPELSRLRELYGDDRQKMSQEMMNLYKREKINPLGGCLPILVQMPVFISLYWVLFESVQLRQAPFMLWVQDLSAMDPYFILPILMGASMFLQMHLNPTPPDPMQAKVMKMLPFIFTVFFLWFPAGLVLYWLTNNILSIAQQWYITRKIENEAAARKAKG